MKKWLVLALTCLMVLGLATVSLAGTVYLDVWSGGEADLGGAILPDLSQTSIGVDIPMDEFKLSGNLSTGKIKDIDWDTTSILLKCSNALINEDKIRLDVTTGFFYRGIEIDEYIYGVETISAYSLMIGFDTKLVLDKNVWVDFSYCLGINPTGDISYTFGSEDYDIDSISVLNCKLNYLFTDKIGASLGYYSEKIEGFIFKKETFSGLTIGAFYKF